MSLHSIEALVPEDFSSWPMESVRILGRQTTTARRRGVTFVITLDAERWWHVEKIHGGKVVAHFTARRIPERVHDAIRPSLPVPGAIRGRLAA